MELYVVKQDRRYRLSFFNPNLPSEEMMNQETKENMRKWIDALRSGKYEQGHGWLRSEVNPDSGNMYVRSRFCCLGVACDLFIPSAWDEFNSAFKVYIPSGTGDSRAAYYNDVLPEPVVELLGLPDAAGRSGLLPWDNREEEKISLVGLNDAGMPFHQIADVIEYAFLGKE